MATTFPGAIQTFPPRQDGDPIPASIFENIEDTLVAVQTKTGAENSVDNTSQDYAIDNFFTTGPPATTMWVYQATAPVGWVYQGGISDVNLAVQGGLAAYSAPAGTTAGDFQMTVPQMPAHTHNDPSAFSNNGANGAPVSADTDGTITNLTESTGGEDGTYRPRAAIGIIVQWAG